MSQGDVQRNFALLNAAAGGCGRIIPSRTTTPSTALQENISVQMTLSLVGILGVLLVGVISPGPSFLLVARTSIASSRLDGLATAIGMGVGGAIFGTIALLGLSAMLAQVTWLYAGLKVAGGLYLVYLGVLIWRGASDPLVVPSAATTGSRTLLQSFLFALMTQLSNPKTAVFYGSVFAALLPVQVPTWMLIILPVQIFALETTWYALVAMTFSAGRPRSLYLGAKRWIDRVAGGVMGVLGGRLIFDTVKA